MFLVCQVLWFYAQTYGALARGVAWLDCSPGDKDCGEDDDKVRNNYLVSCPTWWSISLLFGFLYWSSTFPTQISEKFKTALC